MCTLKSVAKLQNDCETHFKATCDIYLQIHVRYTLGGISQFWKLMLHSIEIYTNVLQNKNIDKPPLFTLHTPSLEDIHINFHIQVTMCKKIVDLLTCDIYSLIKYF